VKGKGVVATYLIDPAEAPLLSPQSIDVPRTAEAKMESPTTEPTLRDAYANA
jgi:hypothetical protein